MSDTPPSPRRRRSTSESAPRRLEPQPGSSVVAIALLLAGATAAIFLAGGADRGNLGVFLLCAGLALIVSPPRTPVPRGVGWALAATFLCATGALLPARLFGESVWRKALADAPDLLLPGTVSADPAQTVFWLTVLLATFLIGAFILTQPVRSRPLFGLALGAAAVCGVYAALCMYARLSGWHYPFASNASFGFLPNRNHTATLLVTGSVLSTGVLLVAFRERWWVGVEAAIACLLPCVIALCFFSESRAGVIFLLVGVVGWVAGLGTRHWNRTLLLAVLIVIVAAGGIFFSQKSSARDRLLQSMSTRKAVAQTALQSNETTPEDRLRIYRDTLGMIRDTPLTGAGLGSFSLVFPPYRQASINPNLVLHPESDWLMWIAETGLPASVCLAATACLVFWRWRPSREHPYWPLRWAFLAAALAAVAHGLVDVPAHRAAVGWWVLILAGLALQPGGAGLQAEPSSKSRLARGIFIAGGALCLALGGMLVRAQWFGGPPLPPYVAAQAQAEVLSLYKRGDIDGATRRARRAVRESPLVSGLYYQLGSLLLRDDENDAAVDRAFHLQRLLDPWSPLSPRQQADAWVRIDPVRAAALFTEALDRQERFDRLGPFILHLVPPWRDTIAQLGQFPATQDLLWQTSVARGPELVLAWLEAADPKLVKAHQAQLLADGSLLAKFDAAQRQRLMDTLQKRGDASTLPP